MIVLHDTAGADLSHVEAMATMDEGFGAMDYVLLTDPRGDRWVGQVVQPNRNVSTVGDRLEPTILRGLELMQEHDDVRAVDSVQVFDILLLGSYDGRQLRAARTRPLPGSRVERMDPSVLLDVLGLPRPELDHDASGTCTGSNVVGRMASAGEVPVCLRPDLFDYHLMVVGGTGSGKSNAAARSIISASSAGWK